MGRCLRWLLLIALPLGTGWAAPAPLPPGVEADAREYTRLAMRHDQLLLKFNMHQASAAEQAEMERARASGEAIKAKYAPGRVTAATSAAFSRRLQELSREVIAPAARRWVAEAFPEPEAVAAAFPDDLEQSAALQVLAQTLAQKVGQPTIPEATAKIERYRAAWPRLNPQSRADYGTRLDRIDGLRRSKAFVVRVIERLVPVYANEAGNALRKERFETEVVTEAQSYRRAVGWMLGLLAALPILFLVIGEGRRRRSRPDAGERTWFHLPPELEEVRVFRKRYPVTYRGGKITGARVIETKWEVTTFRPGDGRPFSPAYYHKGIETHSVYELVLEAPDGTKTELTMGILDLPPSAGEIYGVLLSGKTIVLCYNHSKGFFHPRAEGIRDVNRMRGFSLWLACLVVAAVGFLGIDHFLLEGSAVESGYLSANLRTMILSTAPLAALYIALLKMTMMAIRVRQFNARWAPRYQQFMESLSPPLVRHFEARESATAERIRRRVDQARSRSSE